MNLESLNMEMRIIAESFKKKKCLLFHWYVQRARTSHTTYHECKKCGARKVLQSIGIYQPIDYDWVRFDSDYVKV